MLKWTRDSTEVFFDAPLDDLLPDFKQRSFKVSKTFQAKPFTGKHEEDHHRTLEILRHLLQRQQELKHQSQGAGTEGSSKIDKPTVQQKVNRKRRLIESCIARQTTLNLRAIARFTGSAYATVKRVHHALTHGQQRPFFEYPNTKSPLQLEQFQASLAKVEGSFTTIADLRRQHPDCSRRWIGRQLRDSGLRWRLLEKRRKNPVKTKGDPKLAVTVIARITQILNAVDAELLYADEVHFPLFQTADRCWARPDSQDPLIYNRRSAVEAKLSAVAFCSLERFVGVQIFSKDVTWPDFLHCLQQVISSRPAGRRVAVLVDNAAWHTTDRVTGTRAGQFLLFNVPGYFQTNAIENAFSFVRAEFRKRPTVATLEEEAKLLLGIFFHPDNPQRFQGVHRNHLRALIQNLTNNSPQLLDPIPCQPH